MYIGFGTFCYLAWGNALRQAPLVTRLLPADSPFVAAVELLYMIALIITYPLVIHPANSILEHALFKNWR